MGGGGGQTTTSSSGPPAEVLQNYQSLIGAAANQIAQPYNISPLQTSAIQAGADQGANASSNYNNAQNYLNAAGQPLNNAQQNFGNATNNINQAAGLVGGALPYYGQAAGQYGQAGNTYGQAAGAINNAIGMGNAQNYGANVQNYMSPYTQDVVNATQSQFNNQNAQQSNQLLGQAIQSGNAFGGDRAGVAQAALAGQQQLAQAPVIAGLENQGYTNAQNQLATQQGIGLQGAQGLSGIGAGTANLGQGYAGLGTGTAGLGTTLGNLGLAQGSIGQQQLGAAGANEQLAGQYAGLGQQGITNLTNLGQLQQQLSMPGYGQLGWLGNLVEGTGSLSGGQSTTTQNAGGLFSFLKDGGRVGYADGGLVPQEQPRQTIPESHATLVLQQQQLLHGNRAVQMFPVGTKELPLPQGAQRIIAPDGDVFHYNPAKINPQQILQASAAGRENEILGLGPFNKQDVLQRVQQGDPAVAIVERAPDGTEVRAAGGTHSTAHIQMAHMERNKSPGHTVGVEDLRHTVMRRIQQHQQDTQSPQGFATGGPVIGQTSSLFPNPYAQIAPLGSAYDPMGGLGGGQSPVKGSGPPQPSPPQARPNPLQNAVMAASLGKTGYEGYKWLRGTDTAPGTPAATPALTDEGVGASQAAASPFDASALGGPGAMPMYGDAAGLAATAPAMDIAATAPVAAASGELAGSALAADAGLAAGAGLADAGLGAMLLAFLKKGGAVHKDAGGPVDPSMLQYAQAQNEMSRAFGANAAAEGLISSRQHYDDGGDVPIINANDPSPLDDQAGPPTLAERFDASNVPPVGLGAQRPQGLTDDGVGAQSAGNPNPLTASSLMASPQAQAGLAAMAPQNVPLPQARPQGLNATPLPQERPQIPGDQAPALPEATNVGLAAQPPATMEMAARTTAQTIENAIDQQESGGRDNARTSITGAVGRRQIQPATWAQYAKPGENIHNPADNIAVSNRIIADLKDKFDNDPARVAVGYFSGPGNVAPPGSPTPWKRDIPDPNGKYTSSYVSDILGRLNGDNTALAFNNTEADTPAYVKHGSDYPSVMFTGGHQIDLNPLPSQSKVDGFLDKFGAPLLAAFFAAAASPAHSLGQVIGEGGLAGMQTYAAQKQLENNQTMQLENMRHTRFQEQLAQQNQERQLKLEELKASAPTMLSDPVFGQRPAIRDKSGNWIYMDTGLPVIQTGSLSTPQMPKSDDPARPFKDVKQPSSSTMTQAMQAGLHGQAMLDAIPGNLRNDIEAIANYDAPITNFSKMGRSGISQDKALGWVRQVNPDYDQTWYSLKGTGLKNFYASTSPNSPLVQARTYNTAIGHAGELADGIRELHTANPGIFQEARNAGIPFLSYLAAHMQQKKSTGTPEGMAWAKINAVLPLYGGETGKFYSGGQSTDSEKKDIQAPYNPNLSYPEMMTALHTQKEMYKSKTAPLEAEYKDVFDAPGLSQYGTKKNVKEWNVARQNAIESSDKIDRYYNESTAGMKTAPSQVAPAQAAPDPGAGRRQVGQIYMTPNGPKKWVGP